MIVQQEHPNTHRPPRWQLHARVAPADRTGACTVGYQPAASPSPRSVPAVRRPCATRPRARRSTARLPGRAHERCRRRRPSGPSNRLRTGSARDRPGRHVRSGRRPAFPTRPRPRARRSAATADRPTSCRASRALARSLSTTASTPWRAPKESTTTGMPPPPRTRRAHRARAAGGSSGSSTIERGVGDATTRRQRLAIHRDRPAALLSRGPSPRWPSYDGPDGLGRPLESRIERVDNGLRDERRDRTPPSDVPELAFEEVADHALGLGAEHVERIGAHVAERLALEREQPDLRTVAVRDHQLVFEARPRRAPMPATFTFRCATSASSDSLRRSNALPPEGRDDQHQMPSTTMRPAPASSLHLILCCARSITSAPLESMDAQAGIRCLRRRCSLERR